MNGEQSVHRQFTCCIQLEILALEVRDHCRSSDVDI